jgi:excisionase family DNA binding protein
MIVRIGTLDGSLTDMDSASRVLTVRQVAELLHCHPSTIYRLVKQRQIPVLKLAKDYRFARADVLNWIAGLEGTKSHTRGRRTSRRRSGF